MKNAIIHSGICITLLTISLSIYSCSTTYRHYQGPRLPDNQVAVINIQDKYIKLIKINESKISADARSIKDLHLLTGEYVIEFMGSIAPRNPTNYSASSGMVPSKELYNAGDNNTEGRYRNRKLVRYKIVISVKEGRRYGMYVNSKYPDGGYVIMDVTTNTPAIIAESELIDLRYRPPR